MSSQAAATDELRPLLPQSHSHKPDERTPLVPSYSSSSALAEGELSDANTSAANHKPDEEIKELSWRWYLFYIFLIVGGAVAVGLLIKGFIDAGDKEFDLKGALKSALGGGLSGAAAMVLQVLTLMPLRTTMNYQYRYGTSTLTALRTLANTPPSASSSPSSSHSLSSFHGINVKRFYAGLHAALLQAPLSRFFDTAANAGIIALLDSNTTMKAWPTLVKTFFASGTAAVLRMGLVPVDTVKTTLQTQGGGRGWKILRDRVRKYGIGSLWYGAIATAAATFVGHYPWFGTYNYLSTHLPLPSPTSTHLTLLTLTRRAFIGFAASVISDTSSNSLRVLKTYRQVNETRIGYWDAAREVVSVDGWRGLFGRGLATRIWANGMQGIMFTVLWGWFMDIWKDKTS